LDKRTFIKSIFLGTTGVFTLGFTSALKAARKKRNGMASLCSLNCLMPMMPLEPYIDARTMELHHSKHHAAYTEKFNAAVAEAGLTGKTALEILSEVSKYPAAVRNNGGGYLNHKLFWKMLAPATGKLPSKELMDALNRDFGSLDAFKEKFNAAAKSVFGSG